MMMNLLSKTAIRVNDPTKHLRMSSIGLLPASSSYSSFIVHKLIHGVSFKCARVGGVEIPDNKRLEYSLQHIHGVGRAKARKILCDINICNKKTCDLTPRELRDLRDEVDKHWIGGDLKRRVEKEIKELKDIQCYRGIRHIHELPVRGQRTRSNGWTVWVLAQKKKAALNKAAEGKGKTEAEGSKKKTRKGP